MAQAAAAGSLAVLRIYHSAVVTAWRERDRELRRLGVQLLLITARRWNEGGSDVEFDAAGDPFVRPAATLGRHPYLFIYDPRPLYRALKHHRFSVIDVHEEPASLAALEVLLLRRLARQRAPVIFYGAQNIDKRFPPPFRWIERWALHTAAGAHCCNAEAGEIFERKGLRGTVRTLGLGVDLELFAPGNQPAERPFRIGYVGRLEAHKGVDVLLRAVAPMEDAELHLFGSGPEQEALERLAASLHLGSRARFHPHRSQADLADAYRSVHVVAVPSRTTPAWVEQFGRVVVEAMACGRPVLGSDSGSIPEVLGNAGLLATEGDVDAWTIALEKLREDPQLRATLARRGLERAQRYGWPVIAAEHAQLYEDVAR